VPDSRKRELLDRKYFPAADGNNNISPGAPINGRLTVIATFQGRLPSVRASGTRAFVPAERQPRGA